MNGQNCFVSKNSKFGVFIKSKVNNDSIADALVGYAISREFEEYFKDKVIDRTIKIDDNVLDDNSKIQLAKKLLNGDADNMSEEQRNEIFEFTYDCLAKFYTIRGDASITGHESNESSDTDNIRNTIAPFATPFEKRYAIGLATSIMQLCYRDMILGEIEANGKKTKSLSREEMIKETIDRLVGVASDRAGAAYNAIRKNAESSNEEIAKEAKEKLDVINNILNNFGVSIQGLIQTLALIGDSQDLYWSQILRLLSDKDLSKAFFDEVIASPSLRWFDKLFSRDNDASVESIEDKYILDPFSDDMIQEMDDVDRFTTLFGDKNSFGNYSNFMKHVDDFTRAFIATIPRLKYDRKSKDSEWIPDMDNIAGYYEFMNPNEVIPLLYFNADVSSPDDFVASIEKMAKDIPGFEGLHFMAEKLRNDAQFKYYFFTIFGKQAVNKSMITRTESGLFASRLSNPKANRFYANRDAFIKSVKSTSLYYVAFDKELNDIDISGGKAALKIASFLQSKNDTYLPAITSILSTYIPQINEKIITAYLLGDGTLESSIKNRMNVLNVIANKLISEASTSRDNHAKKMQEYRNIGHDIYLAKQQIDNYQELGDDRKITELRKQIYENQIEGRKVLVRDYLSEGMYGAIDQLSKIMSDYIYLDAQLNSLDPHNHLSSDVLNSSYITYISSLLSDRLNLKVNTNGKAAFDNTKLNKFGELKLGDENKITSHEFDFSNILLTHDYEGGTIKGLFRLTPDGKGWVVEDGANKLLQFELFNGAKDDESGEGAAYDELVRADFGASAIIQFFNSIRHGDKESNQAYGKYFIRIPSDAPNIFTVTMTHYDIGEIGAHDALIQYAGSMASDTELRNDIRTSLDLLRNNKEYVDENGENHQDKKDYNKTSDKASFYSFSSDKDTIAAIIADKAGGEKYSKEIFLGKESAANKYLIDIKDGDVLLRAVYNEEGSKKYTTFYIRGKKSVRNGRVFISNPSLESINGGYSELVDILSDSVYELVKNNYVFSGKTALKCNRKHIVFEAYRNMFMQELNNMAKELFNIFEFENGVPKLVNGIPQLKEKYAKNPNLLYSDYHHIKGKVFDVSANGDIVLLGNVFNSNKFTLVSGQGDSAKFRNYGQELLSNKDIFNFFKGGEQTKLGIKIENDQYAGLELSNLQRAEIDDMIDKFIADYSVRSMQKMSEFITVIPKKMYSNKNAIDFALNYRIAFDNLDDLLYGDTKFYGSAQDVLKRAKEVIAGGIPTGMTNYSLNGKESFTRLESILDDKDGKAAYSLEYDASDGSKKNYDIHLNNKFRAITIYNTVNLSQDVKDLVEYLVREKIMDANTAEKYLDTFAGNKTNDGQSWITFPEWVRRITMRGEFFKYQDLIEKISTGEPLSSDDVSEFIQVQKNFYYDNYYDAEFNRTVSRQIKNAEFVIIPQMQQWKDENGVHKTTLGKLHDWMLEHNIDQVNTREASKAAKKCEMTLWDNDGNVNWDKFNEEYADMQNEGGIQEYSYNFLYRQLETPQHVDAKNKAGVQLMKKVIDNIDDNDPILGPIKREFLQVFSANIKGSFDSLAETLNVSVDENGNIKTDADGNITVDIYSLYEKLRTEARRLGINSNELEYLTIDESTGLPMMSSHFTIFSNKLESIVQSMINRTVTRQELPGFHGVQVSGLGMTEMFVGEKGGVKVSKTNPRTGNVLRYHPDGENYIEVVVPRFSCFDKYTDEQIFKEDENGENMLEKAGLDKFIGYRIPTEGKQSIAVMKIVGFVDKAQGSTIIVPDDWVAQTGADFDVDSIYAVNYKMFDTPNGISHTKYIAGIDENSTRKRYYRYLKDFIRRHKEDKRFFNKEMLEKYVNELNDLNYDEQIQYDNLTDENQELELSTDDIKRLSSKANTINAKTFDEFSKLSVEEQNTKDARDSRILDLLIKIMESKSILEEQLNQSHCRDIKTARDNVTTNEESTYFNNRSQYDIYDQIDWQDDCMSGATLKAFSVARDTFCSICNKIKPRLKQGFTVQYDNSNDEHKFEKDNGKYTAIRHNTLGWSENGNRNVDGFYITTYSSETTAYHLDAVKLGGIQNLNTYTFGVYKTFIDMGSTYKIALSFIKQPGVKEIVNCWQQGRSIYNKDYNTAFVDTAIKNLARRMGILVDGNPVDQYTNIDKVLEVLEKNESCKEARIAIFKELGYTERDAKNISLALNGDSVKNIPYSEKLLMDRLENKGLFSIDENTGASEGKINNIKNMFDLITMLQFHSMNSIVNTIENYSRICSPDKFGAKQTAFATNKIIDDIQILLEDGKAKDMFVINEDNTRTSMLESLYPGFDFKLKDDEDNTNVLINFINYKGKSSYPTLYNFLKYSTCVSLLIQRNILDTQKPQYRACLYRIADFFNRPITEDMYNDFKAYSTGYGFAKALCKLKDVPLDFEFVSSLVRSEDFQDVTFPVDDLNNPSNDDKEAFSELTPANKINFIKYHFPINALVFDYLRTNIFNNKDKNKLSAESISVNYDTADIEILLNLFRRSYFNSNWFVKEATKALVDYAIVVDHFKMTRNGISRIIPNDVLRDLGYMDIFDIRSEDAIRDIFGVGDNEEVYDAYVRSHSDKVKRIKLQQNTGLYRKLTEGSIKDIRPIYCGKINEEDSLGRTYGLINENGYQKYVRLIFGNNDVLFKSYVINDNLFYYPVNRLESYEFTEWSSNQMNNIFYEESAYVHYCDNYDNESFRRDLFNKQYRYSRQANKDKVSLVFDDFSKKYEYEANDIKRQINEKFVERGEVSPIFIISHHLRAELGKKGHSIQTIVDEKGISRQYIFSVVPWDEYTKSYTNVKKLYTRSHTTKQILKKLISKSEDGFVSTKKQTKDPLEGLNADYAEIVKKIANDIESKGNGAINYGKTIGDSIVMITPYEKEDVKHSSVKDFTSAVKEIQSAARREIIGAKNILEELKHAGIDLSSTESIEAHKPRISNALKRYVSSRVNYFDNNSIQYLPKPDSEEFYSIDSMDVMELIKKDRNFRDSYLKFLLEYNKFIHDYEHFLEYDTTGLDAMTENNVKSIQDLIRRLLNNNHINASKRLFITEYFKSISTDPLIQEEIFCITDGYNNVSGFESMIASSLEAGVPLMQVIIKDVLGDIEGRTMKATLEADDFYRRFSELEKSGNFNWDHLIDADGSWYKDYSKELPKILKEKKKELERLSETEEDGVYSVNYLKKRLDYMNWINKNFNQRLVKSYYSEINDNERKILESFPEVYSEYLKLKDEEKSLRLSHMFGELDENDENRLIEIKQQLDKLQGKSKYNNVDAALPKLGEPGSSRTHCKEAADALFDYVSGENNINAKYFEAGDMDAFYEVLNNQLNILERYEQRSVTGEPIKPIDVLMNIPEYKKAYRWIKYNANLVLADDELRKKIRDARETMATDSKEISKPNNKFWEIVRESNAQDIYGDIDGRKISDENKALIKARQEFRSAANTGLIKATTLGSNLVFAKKFTDKMFANYKPATKSDSYLKQISKINAILTKAFTGGSMNLSLLTIDELNELATMYSQLVGGEIKKYAHGAKNVREFMKHNEDNIEFETDRASFEEQKSLAVEKDKIVPGYLDAWLNANLLYIEDEDGAYYVPNKYLYSYMKPKGNLEIKENENGEIVLEGDEEVKKCIDLEKTNAKKLLAENVRYVPNHYYRMAMHEAAEKGEAYFNEWKQKNHYYNPFSRSYEPLRCWTREEYTKYRRTSQGDTKGFKWEPRRDKMTRNPKKEFINEDYIAGENSRLLNYDSKNGEYRNNDKPILTKEEEDAKELLKQIISERSSGNWAKQGNVPVKATGGKKDAMYFAKQLLGATGWYDHSELPRFTERIEYGDTEYIDEPMMEQLRGKYGNLRTRKKFHILPRKAFNGTDAEYLAYRKDLEEKNDKIEEDNQAVHRALLNKDWKSVFKEYIVRGARAKAISDNQYMLYFGLNTLREMAAYYKPLGIENYSKDYAESTKEELNYKTVPMEHAVGLMETFMRRLLFDQHKRNHGILTKASNMLRNASSAAFMTANFTGAAANVTVGISQIWQEILAKQFIDAKYWTKGSLLYDRNVHNFVLDSLTGKTSSLASGLVTLFRVVNEQDFAQMCRLDVNDILAKVIEKMYVLHTGGEHMMQNKALFALMYSHKVVPTIIDGKITNIEFMTKEQYQRECERLALETILTKYPPVEELYNTFKTSIVNNKNVNKDFVLRHKFLVTDFLENLTTPNAEEIRNEFISIKDELKKKYDARWDELSDVYSQFEFKDGKIGFVKEKELYQYEDKEELWRKLGAFRQKCFSINQKIHGVYDKLGAAKMEEQWLGALIMQFHKHIYPGIMKRFRWNGYYNEIRESTEKGSLTSLIDFLHADFDKILAKKGMTKEQADTFKTIQGIFNYATTYLSVLKTRWHLLNDAEKANILRNFGDVGAMLITVALAVALMKLWDDDDKDSYSYNLIMRTIDRTELELQMYGAFIPGITNPLYGPINETKTLWSNPAASMSIIEDFYDLMSLTTDYLNGEEVDFTYRNGRYRGQNKFAVKIKNHIPVYRGINQLMSLPNNNKAFAKKVNPLQKFAKRITEEQE